MELICFFLLFDYRTENDSQTRTLTNHFYEVHTGFGLLVRTFFPVAIAVFRAVFVFPGDVLRGGGPCRVGWCGRRFAVDSACVAVLNIFLFFKAGHNGVLVRRHGVHCVQLLCIIMTMYASHMRVPTGSVGA